MTNPVVSSPTDIAECRKKLAEKYGFKQIGEPLPQNVTLQNILDSIPKKVFETDGIKAWKSVLISLSSYTIGLFIISKAPWYLLPLAWFLTGTAATGLFVVGHDCAHKSFSRNKLLEDIVGTLAFLPLIYPYEPWRIKHDMHHAKTNMLSKDTAWLPVRKETFISSPLFRTAMIYGYGPLRPWMSIAHWLFYHFDLKRFRPREIKRVKISIACVIAFMAIGWPLIIYMAGITGWMKFWLMPWLWYHFWVMLLTGLSALSFIFSVLVLMHCESGLRILRVFQSAARIMLELSLHYSIFTRAFLIMFTDAITKMSTITMVHHTAPHIPFKRPTEWNAAQAQLNGTIHCDYPRWIEFFIHDINVHIPHHISPKIPSYNLRAAHKSLRENWGKYLNEASWNWRLMKTILTMCHVYDKEQNYVSFDQIAPGESYPIKFLRKYMPNTA